MSRWRQYGGWESGRAFEVIGSLTDRDRMLMAAAYEAGRNEVAMALYEALGLGSTFDRVVLEGWRERQMEYSLHALSDEQRDHVVFRLLSHERDYKPKVMRQGREDEYMFRAVAPPIAERLPEPAA